jgi:hypothetical protein
MPPGPAEPGATGDEPGGQQSAKAHPTAEEPAAEEPADKNGGGGPPWSPAPLPGQLSWARPATDDTRPDVDPAADWERLAAGVHTSSWRAQTDADVANEWPGPPLRAPMRNRLLARDPGFGPAGDRSTDDVQTDPGQPGPRPAAEEPGQPRPPKAGSPGQGEGSTAVPPEASAASPVEAGPAAPTKPDQPEPAQPARETRRGRSRRAAADVPTEPDAADEWITLLTADPTEE